MTSAGSSDDRNIARDETSHLVASDKVEGTAVYNKGGENIGSIYNFMVDKASGQVAYAVMSFDGMLGIGERYHPLPWKKLTYDTNVGGFVVDITREQLEGAPSYKRNERPWENPDYGRSVYDYYGVPYAM